MREIAVSDDFAEVIKNWEKYSDLSKAAALLSVTLQQKEKEAKISGATLVASLPSSQYYICNQKFSAFPQPMYLKILFPIYAFCTKKMINFVHFAYCIIKKFFV